MSCIPLCDVFEKFLRVPSFDLRNRHSEVNTEKGEVSER